MKDNTLVFSIALNGYQLLYKQCIASHQRFASLHGYRYQVVTRPYATALGVECCWLKLTLMLEALAAGYDRVLFVDADAYINETAPKLETALCPEKFIYLAKSYTGRFNSGVILIKNSSMTRQWLQSVIASRHENPDTGNSVGWGENGHIIQYAQGCEFVGTLDRRWNNTYDPALNDYIRHFSYGPLRNSIWLNLSHKILSRLTKLVNKVQRCFDIRHQAVYPQDKLLILTKKVLQHYTYFARK